MALSKNYKRYASGGRNRNLRMNDGLRAMQEQSDRKVQALRGLEEQNRIQSRPVSYTHLTLPTIRTV